MMSVDLNELALQYRSGRSDASELVFRIVAEVYREPRRFGFDNEDAAAEAMLKYRHRILSFIERFQDRGITFEAYLGSCLRFLAKTVRRDLKNRSERDLVCERADLPCDPVEHPYFQDEGGGSSAPACGLDASKPSRTSNACREALAKRLVFLLLKCVWEAEEEDVLRVAQTAHVDPAWLGAVATQARRALSTEFERFERLRARRNISWGRINLLEAKLCDEPCGSHRRALEAKLARERVRLERALGGIKKFKPLVPNSIVARILGVPKGTVDSGIYYLRKQYTQAGGA